MTWGSGAFSPPGLLFCVFSPPYFFPCYDIGPWGRQKQERRKKQKEEKATVPRREGRGRARRASVERGGGCKWYYIEVEKCEGKLPQLCRFLFLLLMERPPPFRLSRREARCDVTEEGPSGHFLFLILGR